MPGPLTDARLADLDNQAHSVWPDGGWFGASAVIELVAEVRRLRAVVTQMQQAIDYMGDSITPPDDDQELVAEVHRLRSALLVADSWFRHEPVYTYQQAADAVAGALTPPDAAR